MNNINTQTHTSTSTEELVSSFLSLSIRSTEVAFPVFKKAFDKIDADDSSIQYDEAILKLQGMKLAQNDCAMSMKLVALKLDYAISKSQGSHSLAKVFRDTVKRYPKVISHLRRTKVPSRLVYEALCHNIKGQDQAIADVLGYTHQLQRFWDGVSPRPQGAMLLMGPSGCGKSYLVNSICDTLDAIVISIDASRLTSEGYIGVHFAEEIYDRLKNLPDASEQNVIIHVDEVDKLWHDAMEMKGSVVNELLTFLDPKTKHASVYRRDMNPQSIDISRFGYILSGAFTSLTDKRKTTTKAIGFGASSSQNTEASSAELLSELADFGMPKEILGRILTTTEIKPMTAEALLEILESDNSYMHTMLDTVKDLGGDITITEDDKRQIVDRALAHNLGARALHTEIYNFFQPRINELLINKTH